MYIRSRYLILFFLTVGCLFLELSSVLATEEKVDDGAVSANALISLSFDTQLSFGQAHMYKGEAEQLYIHFSGHDIHRNLRLLRTPQYVIDLTGQEVTVDNLRDLVSCASKISGLKLQNTKMNNAAMTLISQLTGLTDLDLSHNEFDDVGFSCISALSNLRDLNIGGNKINAHALKYLLPLRVERLIVYCISLGIEGARLISQLSYIRELDVSTCNLDNAAIQMLLGLSNLATLDISHNDYLITNELEVFLKEAQQRSIKVKCEQEKRVTFGERSSRKYIKLEISSSIEEHELERLKSLDCLEILLKWCSIIPDRFYRYRGTSLIISPQTLNPYVEVLTLWACGLVYDNLRSITGLTRLRKLDLSSNRLGDDVLPCITLLTKLEFLSIESNCFSNLCVSPFLDMPKLRELDIGWNESINDDVAGTLLANTTLKKLNIRYTSISRNFARKIINKYMLLNNPNFKVIEEDAY